MHATEIAYTSIHSNFVETYRTHFSRNHSRSDALRNPSRELHIKRDPPLAAMCENEPSVAVESDRPTTRALASALAL